MVSPARRAGGIALGLLADLALGDPPTKWHPVGWFGATMTRVERRCYRDERAAGIRYAGAGVAIGAGAGTVVSSATAATAICAAGRGLMRSADAVARQLEVGDVPGARDLLPALAGRDPAQLDEKEIARAVVESVAENTVDAIVAPVWWTLVAGPRGAFAHRAVNTMDAMVGHHSDRYERYGWAAARLDDAAAWIPARLTAALVAIVRPRAACDIFTAVRQQAPAHPSPNAGVAEAAYAAALGVQLGGTNRYHGRVDHRPALGYGRCAEPADIRRATALCRDVTLATAGSLGAVAAIGRAKR
jgi:adenosylcobinamide-phosphate synthase